MKKMHYRRIQPEHKHTFPRTEILALLATRPDMLRIYLLGERIAREMGAAAACRDSGSGPKLITSKE